MRFLFIKKNQGDTIQFITTEDFAIKHKGKLISKSMVNKIFPPSPITGDYILFARLRPKISEEIPGEELKNESLSILWLSERKWNVQYRFNLLLRDDS